MSLKGKRRSEGEKWDHKIRRTGSCWKWNTVSNLGLLKGIGTAGNEGSARISPAGPKASGWCMRMLKDLSRVLARHAVFQDSQFRCLASGVFVLGPLSPYFPPVTVASCCSQMLQAHSYLIPSAFECVASVCLTPSPNRLLFK